jgi:hypothetical protein
MAQKTPEEEQWKKRILKQCESGLSVAAWCRQNNIHVHTFRYRRDKIFPKPPLTRSAFKEIVGEPKNASTHTTGISFECQGIYIHVGEQFDPLTLKQCLQVLKEMSC